MNTENFTEKKISLRGIDLLDFYGPQDRNIKLLENLLDAKLFARGNEILFKGEAKQVETAERVISEIIRIISQKGSINLENIETIIRLSDWENNKLPQPAESEQVILYTKKSMIKPRTDGQIKYWKSANKNDIVCAIGPAGTGKTFLAVAIAVAKLRDKVVDRIILCRPAVEAGESLGFLPGDFKEKIDPYLRPLYDALYDMVPLDKLKRQLDSSIIEIVPLAYMRGRTLNNCFVILDEAQNTTPLQMKMFLTRLGANSQAIITGDVTQVDLPTKQESGLIHIQKILKNIDGIGFVSLTDRDVVRHPLVREIIKAYEKYELEK